MLTKHSRLTTAVVVVGVIAVVAGAVTKGTIKANNKTGKVVVATRVITTGVATEVGATRIKIAKEAVAIIKMATEAAARVVVAINKMLGKIKIATGVATAEVVITNRITTTSTEITKAKAVTDPRGRMRESSDRARYYYHNNTLF